MNPMKADSLVPANSSALAQSMVELQISESDTGRARVAFCRQVWSDRLGRSYMDTDVILILKNEMLHPICEDFNIYKELGAEKQREVLLHLKSNLYTGRILSVNDLPVPPPLPIETVFMSGPEMAPAETESPQGALF